MPLMPLLNLYTSAASEPSREPALLKELSGALAKLLGKPESYVMTCLAPQTKMTFAGNDAPCCYAELKNIGTLSPEQTARISAALCRTLSERLDIPQDRIYLVFQDVPRHLWGFDGRTFG